MALMELLIDHDELDKYHTKSLQELIQYKWDTYGHRHHLMGCVLQFFSTLIIIIYICLSYLREPDAEDGALIPILLAIAVAYPALYESF